MIKPSQWAIIFGKDCGDQVDMVLNHAEKNIISKACDDQAEKIPKRSVPFVQRNMRPKDITSFTARRTLNAIELNLLGSHYRVYLLIIICHFSHK